MKLSLAMIVKDEADHLGHCLDSVRDLVDEMVVLDTGSRDGTVDVARERGARVDRIPWEGDFAAARNASLARATGDWVLVLDADEAVDVLDHPRIREAVAQDQVPAFRLILRNYFPDGSRLAMDAPPVANPGGYSEGAGFSHCGDSTMLRLFRRLPGAAFTGRIHEAIDPFFEARGLPIHTLPAVIHHYGQTLPSRVAAKKPVYLDIARRDARERPEAFEAHVHLVLQAASAEDWPATLEAFEAMEAHFPQRVHTGSLFSAALALQNLDRHAEALAVFERLLALDPTHAAGMLRRGVSLAAQGRAAEARRAFQGAVARDPAYPVPRVFLADLEQREGSGAEARAVLQAGLLEAPADPVLWNRLVQLDLQSGDPSQAAQDAWAALRACPGGGEGLWHRLVAASLLKQKALEPAAAVIRMGLATFPGDPGLARLQELLG
jgi:tetratricopeptide (TPR) repeat protein